jgi:hypothetical protein
MSSAAGEIRPWGIMSLWDMINFNIYKFCIALHMAESEECLSGMSQSDGHLTPEQSDELTKKFFPFVDEQCAELGLQACRDHLKRMQQHLGHGIEWSEWYALVRTLREMIVDGLKRVACYYYPQERAEIYWRFMDQWGPILAKFQSATEEAMHAVDCYALDKNTASVFHSMRIAEIGLRALAKERGVRLPKKPLEWGNWQDIITAIRNDVKRIQNAEAGPKKDAALSFYQGALGEFESFKDVYRNQVMHVRESYGAETALHVLNHVREFMRRLSTKIDEDPKKKLNWGLRWKKP